MGFLDEKAAEAMEAVMDNHGIQPGEMLEKLEITLDVIRDLAPVAERMADTSDNLERDIDELRTEVREFNDNSEDMVEAIRGLEDTLEKFHSMFEEMEDN